MVPHGTLNAMDEPQSQSTDQRWQVWVETGGTFTDCIARAPNGTLHRAKVLSSSALRGTIVEAIDAQGLRIQERWNAPADFVRGLPFTLLGAADTAAIITAYDPVAQTLALDRPVAIAPGAAFEVRFPYEAPVLAARLVTHTLPDQPLPPMALRVATTRGTNALLTRRGTPPAFFVTAGFGDLLEIGTQQRPDLFALDIIKPTPLTGAIVEVEERLSADGSVVRPLDEDAVAHAAQRLVAQGVRTAAVALMHSYRNPAHERRVAEILRSAGFTHVSVSSELAPFVKHLPRAQTAVVNAYLAPILDAYLGGIEQELPADATLHVMTSAGGLVRHSDFHPKDSLLSGPAGGVVGALHAGRAAGFERIIAFDMGGTSTDVARCDGGFDYVWEHTVGDAHLVAPALAIESVAAGGGSICYADKHGLHVGPQSAGANPGPASYGAGGPLTITDVNLLLDRVQSEHFEIPLDYAAAERAADSLLTDLAQHTGETTLRDSVLRGLLDIANERMADAIRRISLRRGYDPADYALVAFGGAGDQHACAVAAKLGIRTVIVPPDASLLSAWGLGQATIERFAEQQTEVEVHVLQGERPMAAQNRTLGKFKLSGIPSAQRGVPQIEVTFDIDANGILNVTAKDNATGKDQKITITSSSGLSKEEVERMAKDAEAHASEDKEQRDTIEARNGLDSMVYNVEKMLKDSEGKVEGTDRTDAETALADSKSTLEGQPTAAELNTSREKLTTASHNLASAMYKANSAQTPTDGDAAAAGTADEHTDHTAQGKDEGVIDAEYEDVDKK